MPNPKYVPKHRNAPVNPVRKGVRNAAVFSGVAVAATGVAVSAGVVSQPGVPFDGAAVALSAGQPAHRLTADELAQREQQASRSSDDRRQEASRLKEDLLSNASGVAKTHTEDLTTADPRTIARALLPQYGFDESQFSCLDALYNSESGWDVHADNPTSSAYGIPQALPGSKMASAGPNWANDAETQIRWGLEYIRSSYGTPCSAWAFKQGHNFY
ncbi:MAG TPA: lytic transglycosylase domain-containing protein [Nocardioidaceae bacterium]|nr:lytic transglycosylase domain-containing protein [Nocardioidaceae bacterium]